MILFIHKNGKKQIRLLIKQRKLYKEIKKRLPSCFYSRQPPAPYRLLRHRCSAHVTAKLTTAPIAASTAVLTMSCMPSCATTLSSIPPPVPIPSCALFIFIGSPLLSQATFHRLQHAECQGEVPSYYHHLRRQFHRRSDNQLAGHRQRFLDPVVKCRFLRFWEADCFCIVHCFFVFN